MESKRGPRLRCCLVVVVAVCGCCRRIAAAAAAAAVLARPSVVSYQVRRLSSVEPSSSLTQQQVCLPLLLLAGCKRELERARSHPMDLVGSDLYHSIYVVVVVHLNLCVCVCLCGLC